LTHVNWIGQFLHWCQGHEPTWRAVGREELDHSAGMREGLCCTEGRPAKILSHLERLRLNAN